MDLTQQPGILGTGAYLASDLALLAYIFMLVPAMLVGFGFARRHLFVPHHKLTMTTITIVNWIIIILLMIVTYRNTVAPNVPQEINRLPFLLPVIHGITGAVAQILATILVIRMWFEPSLPRVLRFEPIKPYMRLTLALWLITAVLGIGMYVTWNIAGQPPIPSDASGSGDTPAITATGEATLEATAEATSEAGAEIEATDDSPAATAESDDDDGDDDDDDDAGAIEATAESTPNQ